jgi:4-amino-4-deoxy-L-arabinose transferase-like glycosyltransferase
MSVTAGRPLEPIEWRDLAWLALALALIVASGYGLRDPWPADEPRFASLARDMATTGERLFPRVGGDLYQDKPPVFFWLLALAYAAIGSVRGSFLLPSLLAAGGTLFLIYDIGRRLVDRRAGLIAALGVVCTLQFVLVMRGAQIDGVLCFLTTLSLYGLVRHLLLGAAWGWYFLAGLAAGVGVATKGVGFLPLLLLLPFFAFRRAGWHGLADVSGGGARWALAPLGLVLGVSLWLVPMLTAVALSDSPDYAAYRDEILFRQTVTRYAQSWHHHAPWYYFLVEVIPALWLPWSLALFWLVPRWRDAWRERDARVWVPLAWVVLVVLFFSLSAGKRGVYILPALPGLAIAAMPYLGGLIERRGLQRAMLALGAVLLLGASVFLAAYWLDHPKALDLFADSELPSIAPAVVFLVAGVAAWLLAAVRLPAAGWGAVLACLAVVWGYGVAPHMNSQRSGKGFMQQMLARVPEGKTLGMISYKEQFLLHTDRPTVNFGHRRWLEGPQEAYDASAWLNGGADRLLLVPSVALSPCFSGAALKIDAGRTTRESWSLVGPPASTDCARQGNAGRAIMYTHRLDP